MNYNRLKKGIAVLAVGTMLTFSIAGCSLTNNNSSNTTNTTTTTVEASDLNNLFSNRDLDASYDASSPKITLSDSSITSDSSSATVNGNTVTITAAGTYILTGSSKDAQIVVEVGDTDKVQLVFDNVSLTSSQATALFVKQADKVFITLADGTTNSISVSADAQTIDDDEVNGAIYSRDDITINGNGTLNVTSDKTSAIVGNDDVKLVSGTINATGAKHAIKGNDTISVKDAVVTANAGKDGLHSDGNINIVGGNVNIANSNEGIEATIINIAGGDTTVNAKDDGLNAASADSNTSEDPMAVDNNASLNISGGKLTVDSSGDALDSNGGIYISGGETYVSGPTNDGNTAMDFGSEAVITGGTLIAAGSSGMVEAISEKSTQAVMTVNASSNSGTIKVTDSTGAVVAEYTPTKSYACATITSPNLKVGETYKVYCGNTSEDITLSSTVTSNVTATMGGGMKGGMQGGGQMQQNQKQSAPTGQTQMGEGMQAPPDGQMQQGMQAPLDGGMQQGQMQQGQMKQGKMNRGNMQKQSTN